MKKTIAFLSLAGLVLGANYAAASNGGERGGLGLGLKSDLRLKVDTKAETKFSREWPDEFRLMLHGTVQSKTSDSMTIQTRNWGGVEHDNFKRGKIEKMFEGESATEFRKLFGGTVTVKVNAETKYSKDGNAISLNDIAVGNSIVVAGLYQSQVFTASSVKVVAPEAQKKQKVFGEITAKTDTSVTIKNNATGESKIIAVDPETKVNINGEAKTAADIQVGDKGMVKFKTVVSTFVAKFISLFR